jgi:hypothetical protein
MPEFFLRHFFCGLLGAACCAAGIAFPSLAPVLVPIGGSLLAVTGTSILEPKGTEK